MADWQHLDATLTRCQLSNHPSINRGLHIHTEGLGSVAFLDYFQMTYDLVCHYVKTRCDHKLKASFVESPEVEEFPHKGSEKSSGNLKTRIRRGHWNFGAVIRVRRSAM